jgi:hypothetical protein
MTDLALVFPHGSNRCELNARPACGYLLAYDACEAAKRRMRGCQGAVRRQ